MKRNADLSAAVVRFRLKLQFAITGLVILVTAAVLLLAQHRLSTEAAAAIQRDFQHSSALLRNVHAQRRAMLVERCQELGRKLHIEAASGDDLLGLLYPGTNAALHEITEEEHPDESSAEHHAGVFHAEFYRFLDGQGNVLRPPATTHAGTLTRGEAAQLRLTGAARERLQFGFLVREKVDSDGPLFDLIALPVVGPEGRAVIATLVLGFEPAARLLADLEPGVKRGVWLGGRMYSLKLPEPVVRQITREIGDALNRRAVPPRLTSVIDGVPHVLLFQLLNEGSAYPPAYEVCLYPLTRLRTQQRYLLWQAFGVGGAFLLLGILAGHVLAVRFAQPMQRLAGISAENRLRRRHAEAALEQTAEGMRRAERFSADASHQLKTPVAVLRAGLEELKAGGALSADTRHEIDTLVHQTSRLSGLIEDLLLLSRMDAGRLKIDFGTVDLVRVVEAVLDDWSVRPDRFALTLQTDLPAALPVKGEQRFMALILENLLENAGKYNRPHGRIQVSAGARQGWAWVVVANTASRPIPMSAREHIFDRFHRAGIGEDIPGYGLGLNLAHELTRLHHGELKLTRSDEEWTEFEMQFPLVRPEPATG